MTTKHILRILAAHFGLAATFALSLAASGAALADIPALTPAPTSASMPNPRLVELLPGTAIAIASADPAWWWTTSEPIRGLPKVASGMTAFEMMSGLSVEDDVLPWAGRIGFAAMGNPAKPSEFVVCIQIKDMNAYNAAFAKLQSGGMAKTGGQWTKSAYHGVPVEMTSAQGTVPAIKLALIKNWLIAGTVNAVPAVIDTWEKHRASIANSGGWETALDQMAPGGVLWGGISGEAIAAAQARQQPVTALPAAYEKYTHTVTIASFKDLGHGLRVDAVNAPTSQETAYMMAKMYSSAPVLTDSFMQQVPNDATAVIAFANPSHWLALTEQTISQMTDGKQQQQFAQAMQMMGPMTAFMNPLTGNMTVSITLDGDTPGLVVTGDAITPRAAKRVAAGLAGTLGLVGLPIVQSGPTYNIKLPPPADGSAPSAMRPAFTSTDSYFSFATDSSLLTQPMGGSPFTLPDFARDANFIGIGNFNGLNALADKAPPPANPAPNATDMKTVLGLLSLDGATWAIASSASKDGSFSQSTIEIDNWDWRTALGNVVTYSAAHPDATLPAPPITPPAPAPTAPPAQ